MVAQSTFWPTYSTPVVGSAELQTLDAWLERPRVLSSHATILSFLCKLAKLDQDAPHRMGGIHRYADGTFNLM